MREYAQMFKQTFDFKGRATRKDFWFAQLFNLLVCILFCMIALLFYKDAQIFTKAIIALEGLYGVITFLPSISLICRRLRDAGFSPYIILISVFGIGIIILFCLVCMPSKQVVKPWYRDYKNNPDEIILDDQDETQNQVFDENIAKNEQNYAENEQFSQKIEQNKSVVLKQEEYEINDNIEEKVENHEIANENYSQTKSARKTKQSTTVQKSSRSKQIKLLQQKRDSGEISIQEYQQEILKLLSK